MKKYSIYLFLIILGIFFINSDKLRAEEICHIDRCFVPAPTIVIPENNKIFYANPVIRGLTWKRTLVDVYLDGVDQGSVILKEEENHLQSFFWQPQERLAPGKHFIYVIAYSTKGYDKNIKSWDQSKESAIIYFTIKARELIYNKTVKQVKKDQAEKIIEKNQASASDQPKITGKIKENKNNPPASVYNRIDGTKNKPSYLRASGLAAIIIIIFVVALVWLIRKKRKFIEEIMIAKIKDEENYPPPPPPINQDSLGI